MPRLHLSHAIERRLERGRSGLHGRSSFGVPHGSLHPTSPMIAARGQSCVSVLFCFREPSNGHFHCQRRVLACSRYVHAQEGAIMATLSIRGLDEKTANILKDQARRSGKSVNLQVVELIRKGLGLAAPAAGGHAHTDLDHLAGTWSAREAGEFAQRTKAFEAVDEEIWR